MPGGSWAASFSIWSIAVPELTPGAPMPWIVVRREPVVALERLGAERPVRGRERRERRHLAGAAAHVPGAEVVGLAAIRRIALHEHALDAAAIDEVIDVRAGHAAVSVLVMSEGERPSAAALA